MLVSVFSVAAGVCFRDLIDYTCKFAKSNSSLKSLNVRKINRKLGHQFHLKKKLNWKFNEKS